jgi:hypothetical protein
METFRFRLHIREESPTQTPEVGDRLRSHFEHNAVSERSTLVSRAIEVAFAVQNQAAVRGTSVRAVELDSRRLIPFSLLRLASGASRAIASKTPGTCWKQFTC